MDYELNGKVTLVTGGTSGIGFATAVEFLRNGAIPIVVGRNIKTWETSIKENPFARDGIFYVEGDVSKPDECQRIVEKSEKYFVKIDILVNSAGEYMEKIISEVCEEDYETVMDTNMKGTYFMCKSALPLLKKTKGVIINIASDAGLTGNLLCTVYCASKGAVIAFSKALALECAPYGVRVNAVCPGDVATPLFEKQLRQANYDLKSVEQVYPINRIGKPEEIAHVVCFLSSRGASLVTGAVWSADGGLSAG